MAGGSVLKVATKASGGGTVAMGGGRRWGGALGFGFEGGGIMVTTS